MKIALSSLRSPSYKERGGEPCLLCGAPLAPGNHPHLRLIHGGATIATADEPEEPHDMGWHPIGAGCAAKPKVRPFVRPAFV